MNMKQRELKQIIRSENLKSIAKSLADMKLIALIVNQSEDAANNYLPSQKDIDNYLKLMGKKDKKEPEVACPECGTVTPISVLKCPKCGAIFRRNNGKRK